VTDAETKARELLGNARLCQGSAECLLTAATLQCEETHDMCLLQHIVCKHQCWWLCPFTSIMCSMMWCQSGGHLQHAAVVLVMCVINGLVWVGVAWNAIHGSEASL
jgi:hypothetical protein